MVKLDIGTEITSFIRRFLANLRGDNPVVKAQLEALVGMCDQILGIPNAERKRDLVAVINSTAIAYAHFGDIAGLARMTRLCVHWLTGWQTTEPGSEDERDYLIHWARAVVSDAPPAKPITTTPTDEAVTLTYGQLLKTTPAAEIRQIAIVVDLDESDLPDNVGDIRIPNWHLRSNSWMFFLYIGAGGRERAYKLLKDLTGVTAAAENISIYALSIDTRTPGRADLAIREDWWTLNRTKQLPLMVVPSDTADNYYDIVRMRDARKAKD